MKLFENFREKECINMEVITNILHDGLPDGSCKGYVNIKVPDQGIDVIYNPISSIANDPIKGWSDNWYIGGIWD